MLELIHAKFAEPLNLDDIARAAGVGERECERAFKRMLGMTPEAVDNKVPRNAGRVAAGLGPGAEYSRDRPRMRVQQCQRVCPHLPRLLLRLTARVQGRSAAGIRQEIIKRGDKCPRAVLCGLLWVVDDGGVYALEVVVGYGPEPVASAGDLDDHLLGLHVSQGGELVAAHAYDELSPGGVICRESVRVGLYAGDFLVAVGGVEAVKRGAGLLIEGTA